MCLCVCLSVCLSVFLSVCRSIYLSFCKSACLSVSQSIRQSIYLCVSNFHLISLTLTLSHFLSLLFLQCSVPVCTLISLSPGHLSLPLIVHHGFLLQDQKWVISIVFFADLLGTIDTLYSHGSTVEKLAWTPSSILIPFSFNFPSGLHSSTLPSDTSSSLPSTVNHISSNVTLPILPSSPFVSSDKLEINSNISSEVNPPVSIWRLDSCGEDHTVRIFQISQ